MLILLPIAASLAALGVLYVLGRPHYLASVIEENFVLSELKVSMIIPARDEADNIQALLESANGEIDQLHEIIVVNDASTDETAEFAKLGGAKVIESGALPKGWNGKPWACQQGAEAATGNLLLFMDADVRIHPGSMRKIRTLVSSSTGENVYSIYPHHQISKVYEELSAYFNSLMVAGINAFGVKSAAGQNSALFGQVLLLDKQLYHNIGGHSGVKDKVLENFYLSEQLKAKGIACHCLLGKGLISMRMFPEGFSELWHSWKKGFVSGAANVDGTALFFSSLWVTAGMLSIASVFCIGAESAPKSYTLFALVAYVINAIACHWAFRIAGSFSLLNALLFPVSLLFYQALFFTALCDKFRGKKTNWKGRMVK